KLLLSVTNPDSGSATEELEVEYEADPIDIGFNSRYLLDIATQIESEAAVLKLADPGSPTLIQDKEPHGALYVLMPMRGLHLFILPRAAGKGDHPAAQGGGRGVRPHGQPQCRMPAPPHFVWSPSPLRFTTRGRIYAMIADACPHPPPDAEQFPQLPERFG